MPDHLAHYVFARRVIFAAKAALPRVNPGSPAFRAGSFGPDPLFNDFSAARRAQGFGMHRGAGREALEKLRDPLKRNVPGAADYAAGFFTHYALDRLCHPSLKAMDARGEARHVPTEAAFDRMLYARIHPRLPLRIMLPESACRIAAGMYADISAPRFQADLNAYWQLRRALLGGGRALDKLAASLSPAWREILPGGTPSPGTRRGMEMLDGLLEQSVAETARQLELFFRAVDRDLPFDSWTDADFSGMIHQ